MKTRFAILTALICLAQPVTMSLALAADAPAIESTPVPATPKPDLSSIAFMEGVWSCSSKSARRPAPTLYTATMSVDPSGYWMVTKGSFAGTSWYPYPSTSTQMTTYDKDAKQWVQMYFDTLGSYDYSTSPGWTGNTMVWTDRAFTPGADITSVSTYTLTKVSDTKTTGASTFTTAKGSTVGVADVCTKQ